MPKNVYLIQVKDTNGWRWSTSNSVHWSIVYNESFNPMHYHMVEKTLNELNKKIPGRETRIVCLHVQETGSVEVCYLSTKREKDNVE